MATIVTRAGKGSALTWTEGDSNFTNLNTDKMESFILAGDSGTSQTIQGGNTLTIAGGTNLNSVASATDTVTVNLDTTVTGLTSLTSATLVTDAINGSTANSPITIAPDGTGDVHLNTDSVRIGDNNSNATLATRGTGDLILTTNEGSGTEGVIRIYDGAGGNITVTPNGAGHIILAHNAASEGLVRVGDGTNPGALVANGAVDLILLADPDNVSGQAALTLEAATGDVVFGPGSSGSVRNTATKSFFGTGAAAPTITTNGAYNLTINTNDGTNTGASITVIQGTNGGLSLTPAGSGGVTIGAGSNTGVSIVRRTQTSSTGINVAAIQRNYTTDTLSTMDGHFAGLAFSQRDSTATQSFYTRIAGVYSTAGTHSFTFDRSTDNFTTPIRQMALSDGQLTLGATTGTTAQVITSYGAQDINLVTNQGTNSGLITITNGANGNITITPNGTGDTLITNLAYNEAVYTGGTTTGTITPNCALAPVQSITLTGSITFSAFTTPISGQTLTLIITQPASGGPYTLTSTMKFAGGSKTLSTAANAIDILTVSYIGTTYYASLAKAFA